MSQPTFKTTLQKQTYEYLLPQLMEDEKLLFVEAFQFTGIGITTHRVLLTNFDNGGRATESIGFDKIRKVSKHEGYNGLKLWVYADENGTPVGFKNHTDLHDTYNYLCKMIYKR